MEFLKTGLQQNPYPSCHNKNKVSMSTSLAWLSLMSVQGAGEADPGARGPIGDTPGARGGRQVWRYRGIGGRLTWESRQVSSTCRRGTGHQRWPGEGGPDMGRSAGSAGENIPPAFWEDVQVLGRKEDTFQSQKHGKSREQGRKALSVTIFF